MKKSTKVYQFIHNLLAIIVTVISFVLLANKGTPDKTLNALTWAFISGITYRMVFDLKTIHFYIGALFATAILFIFDWWYVPFIYLISQVIYRFSCLVVKDGSKTGERPLKREIYIVLNVVNTGIISSLVKLYFMPTMNINLKQDIVAMFIVCVIECAVGLVFIYVDLKQQETISSVTLSIASHLKETFAIYIVYMLMVMNIVIMYQQSGYVGLFVASSCIISLRFAFDKQAKAKQIEAESYTDVLTGVKNKKYYIEVLPEEFTNSCAVFFIDFNGFKSINDRYGHDVGDDVIVLGGQVLQKAVRDKDDVIRLGGDEFMLLIRDADREVCKGVINRIENLCEENIYINGDLEVKISMSIGVAICPEEGHSKSELSVLADEKMYKAKQNKQKSNVVYEI